MISHKIINTTSGKDNWYELNIVLNSAPIESQFSVRFNHASVEVIPFQIAADIAAKDIASRHSNLYIGLSGGVDSEFVANVFLRNNIPFTPIIAIIPGLTEHYYARHWCYKNNITPIIVNLLDHQTELNALALTLLKTIPAHESLIGLLTAFIIKYANDLGGTAIIADPDITPKVITDGPFDFDLHMGHHVDTIIAGHMSELFFKDAVSFFWHTPELLLAIVNNLNPNVNFDIARAELYNVSYRPKQQQRINTLIDQLTFNSVNNFFDMLKVSSIPDICWTRDEIRSLLLKSG